MERIPTPKNLMAFCSPKSVLLTVSHQQAQAQASMFVIFRDARFEEMIKPGYTQPPSASRTPMLNRLQHSFLCGFLAGSHVSDCLMDQKCVEHRQKRATCKRMQSIRRRTSVLAALRFLYVIANRSHKRQTIAFP